VSASSIEDRLRDVRERIAAACAVAGRDADEVTLVAVSKRHPAAAIEAALAAGQRVFGENRVQELVEKAPASAARGCRWHFIGSLQTNKVRELLTVTGLELLHSLDRVRLADALQVELERLGSTLQVLLQLQLTDEESKHGCRRDEVPELLDHVMSACPRLEVQGVMAMGPLEGSPARVFDEAMQILADARRRTGLPMAVASLGMSDDLEVAIRSGSTMVRIGSAIFGERPQH
jgi:pyridoxal phosphate enzyme (YggS family)